MNINHNRKAEGVKFKNEGETVDQERHGSGGGPEGDGAARGEKEVLDSEIL